MFSWVASTPTADPVVLRSTKPITLDESIIMGVVGEVNGLLGLWNEELDTVGCSRSQKL